MRLRAQGEGRGKGIGRVDKKESAIVPNQVFSIVALSMIGVRLLSLPAEVAQVAGRDAWITTIVAWCITIGEIYIFVRLCQRFPQLYFPQILHRVYGRWIGDLFTVSFIALLFGSAGLSLREFSATIRVSILDRTPPWVIWVTVLLASCYLVHSGLETMARLYDILYPVMLLFGLVIIAAVIPQMRLRNLRPILATEPRDLALGVFVALRACQQFSVVGVLLPELRQKQSYASRVLLASGVTLIWQVTAVFSALAVFGPGETAYLVSPVLTLARAIDIPYSLFERMEVLLMVVWVALAFAQVATRHYIINLTFSRVWCVARSWRLPVVILVALGIGLVASLPRDITLNSRIMDYLDYATIGEGLILIPGTYLIAVVTGKRGDRDEKSSARRGA